MSSILWSLGGAGLATLLEVVYRRADTWPLWAAGPALLLTYCVYRALHEAPSLLIFAITFNLFVVGLRVAASQWILGESVVKGNLVAAVALTFGVIIARLWR